MILTAPLFVSCEEGSDVQYVTATVETPPQKYMDFPRTYRKKSTQTIWVEAQQCISNRDIFLPIPPFHTIDMSCISYPEFFFHYSPRSIIKLTAGLTVTGDGEPHEWHAFKILALF